jgi:hypothetical protein
MRTRRGPQAWIERVSRPFGPFTVPLCGAVVRGDALPNRAETILMARVLPARIAAFAFVGALIGLRRGTLRFDEIGAQWIVVLPDQEEHTHAQHREHCSRAPRYEEI